MTRTDTLTTVALALGAFWLWRRHRQRMAGRPQPVRSFQPEAPNPVRPLLGDSLKRGGNAPWRPNVPSSLGTPTDPAGAPAGPTKTLQPPRAPFAPPGKVFLPNLGDGRYSAFSFLSTTPPDLAWGMKVRGNG